MGKTKGERCATGLRRVTAGCWRSARAAGIFWLAVSAAQN